MNKASGPERHGNDGEATDFDVDGVHVAASTAPEHRERATLAGASRSLETDRNPFVSLTERVDRALNDGRGRSQ